MNNYECISIDNECSRSTHEQFNEWVRRQTKPFNIIGFTHIHGENVVIMKVIIEWLSPRDAEFGVLRRVRTTDGRLITLDTKLVDCNLSVRALNCLKAEDLDTVRLLLSYKRIELYKFRHFGKKSMKEVDEFKAKLGHHE